MTRPTAGERWTPEASCSLGSKGSGQQTFQFPTLALKMRHKLTSAISRLHTFANSAFANHLSHDMTMLAGDCRIDLTNFVNLLQRKVAAHVDWSKPFFVLSWSTPGSLGSQSMRSQSVHRICHYLLGRQQLVTTSWGLTENNNYN